MTAFADAVVVAAGASRRMGGRDKVAVRLAGRPLLAWACEAVARAASVRGIVVVAAPERVGDLAAERWVRALDVRVVAGGPRRQDSVAAGARASAADFVLVHDGARPFVTAAVVDRVAAAARKHGAAIPIIPVADSLKRVDDERVAAAVERGGLFRAQTPQGVETRLLMSAYEALGADPARTFDDEAALVAAYGAPVATVAGDPANMKVTVPDDLVLAGALAGARLSSPRVGSATDSHPFGPDDGLRLGGIEIADAPRLYGHSDGDVALHAIAGAVLGAAGLGDLGQLFPAGEARTRGIDSGELLRDVVRRTGDEGWRVTFLDLTIVGARPRLGGRRLAAMREAIAGLVDLPADAVGVKASTGNLTGAEGAGRVITASALATLVPGGAP